MKKFGVKIHQYTCQVELEESPLSYPQFRAKVDGIWLPVVIPQKALRPEEVSWVIIGNRPYEVAFDADFRWVRVANHHYPLEVRDEQRAFSRPSSGDGRIKAPIPGMVRRVLVQAGDSVHSGQTLLVLEAMKMENEIRSPRSGKVISIQAVAGQSVSFQELLVEIG